jgi:hypothetical protein
MKPSYLFLFYILLSVQGCTSALKSKCKKTNWYQHGKSIALSGESVNSDFFAKQCERKKVYVDYTSRNQGFKEGLSSYCSSETVYEMGRLGNTLNIRPCEKNSRTELKKMYSKGLQVFCQPSSGYRQGFEGRGLNLNCPDNLAGGFAKEYNRGRLVYLSEFINKTEKELISLNSQIEADKRDLVPKEQAFGVMDIIPGQDLNRVGEISESVRLATNVLSKKRNDLKSEIVKLRKQIAKNERAKAKKTHDLSQAQAQVKAINAKL